MPRAWIFASCSWIGNKAGGSSSSRGGLWNLPFAGARGTTAGTPAGRATTGWFKPRPAAFTRRRFIPAGVSASGYSRLAVLHHQRHNVKIDEAILRIKNFDVMTDWSAALSERFPIETPDTFVESFADYIACLEPKQSASCIVQIRNPPFGIGHNDAFLDGIENRFQETFLLGQAQKIILHFFRPDAAEPLDEFLKKTGFHDLKSSKLQHPTSSKPSSSKLRSFEFLWSLDVGT